MTWRVAAMILATTATAPAHWIDAAEAMRGETGTTLSSAAQIGKQIFFDPGLSASGRLACASCHNPEYAYSSPEGGLAPPGGSHLDQAPLRAVPSLRYLEHTPRFSRHFYLDNGMEREDIGPAGGFMRDGRADGLSAQALLPLLDSGEMANANVAEVSLHLQHATYADALRKQFGISIFDYPGEAVSDAALALERFELEDESFHPYNSRYDQFVAGDLRLNEQELRGLRLFTDPHAGNCAECHPNSLGPRGRPAAFTDYAYHALGVPRNLAITANADRNFYDLGLCGPRRRDLRTETQYCGYFKTPTLRNVARRKVFFHNGRFTSLEQVLHFYVERDSAPRNFYPTVHGLVQTYDDLPAKYRDRVESADPPFNRTASGRRELSETDFADLIAFLETLDDATRAN